MSEYHKIEGLKIADHDIYVDNEPAVNKVGIALRDILIENLKAKNTEAKK